MHNPVAIGNLLRDYVIELLEAQGYRIEREIRIDTKKVDVLLIMEDDLTRRQIAIEVKNLDHNLSQKEVALIYTEHLSLIQRRLIDEIWVIARRDFSPEAKNWAAVQANLSIFTIAEFEERQFGFHRYVRQLVEIFKEDGLSQYYVEQRASETGPLSQKIDAWLSGSNPRPIAILGGYGMGKTSFCKYLVSKLGQEYLNDTMCRVPIYIRLSEIAKEQELDGLLGKMLASRHRLKNYNFEDIMNLNRKGKLVFIFDGFDEMKHALTWDLFKYNFGQINRTVCDKSRVLVAGRPNAFLSDAEHSWALRGTRISGERLIRMPDWPEYDEITIQPFSQTESETFLRRYLSYNLVRQNQPIDTSETAWIESRVEEFDSLSGREDASRPVHLKIFAELATDKSFTLRNFSVYELYQISADQTIEREMRKPERLPIGASERSKFIEDVGWWLWEKDSGRSLHFNPREVPASIWRQAIPHSHDFTEDAIMRELFSGAFIERKFGENFYFAHRSFLEFFVAKKLVAARQNKLSLGLINSTINDEIIQFIKSSGMPDRFCGYCVELMHRYAGELKLSLLKVIRDYLATEHRFESANFQQHVELLFKALPLYEAADDAVSIPLINTIVKDDLTANNSERSQAALYFLIDTMLYDLKKDGFQDAIKNIIQFLAGNVKTSYWKHAKAEISRMPSLRFSRENIFEYVFLRGTRIGAEQAADGSPIALIDFGRIFSDLTESRKPRLCVANRVDLPESARYIVPMRFSELRFSGHDNEIMLDVLRRGIDTRIRQTSPQGRAQ